MSSELDSILDHIKQFTGCEKTSIRLLHTPLRESSLAPGHDEKGVIGQYENSNTHSDPETGSHGDKKYEILEYLSTAVELGALDASLQNVTRGGSFWTNDITLCMNQLFRTLAPDKRDKRQNEYGEAISYMSLAVIPIISDTDTIGTLLVVDTKRDMFTEEIVTILEIIAGQIGFAFKNKTAIETLRGAIDEITLLRGMLPICAHCKRIRDDKGYWHRVEEYIEDHSNIEFTHGLCPECLEKYYPSFTSEKKTG